MEAPTRSSAARKHSEPQTSRGLSVDLHRFGKSFLLVLAVFIALVAILLAAFAYRESRRAVDQIEQVRVRLTEERAWDHRVLVLIQTLRGLIRAELAREENPELRALDAALLIEQCKAEGKDLDYINLECTGAPAVPRRPALE